MSYLAALQCSLCGETFDPGKVQSYCPKCSQPLLVLYDLPAARRELDRDRFARSGRGMWRWHALLPVHDPGNMLHLGEGDTPLLPVPRIGAGLGLRQVFVKDESLNPTGSFKARGLAAAVSKARELGITRVIIPTAGNAGGAMAAYAARGGLQARIFMPKDTPIANIEESRIAGAVVTLVDGLISDAARFAGELARQEGWFDMSTFKEPYRTEGKKIMGYELAEAFGWTLPDVILYPTGGGTGLVGMWKAFAELEALGWLEHGRRPRMVAVQAEGCAPVVRAFQQGKEACEFWQGAQTAASGLRVPKSFADRLILRDLRESQGTAVAVSEQAILDAQGWLARQEGIFAAPEGAATLAALRELVRQGWVQPEERVVLFNTGSGLKYLHSTAT
ncbi:MAG: threonine synthase [Anaerolineales bacterium]|jgi:threonine synthase|nr:threonine synthase [Anaerolineales bacterium]